MAPPMGRKRHVLHCRPQHLIGLAFVPIDPHPLVPYEARVPEIPVVRRGRDVSERRPRPRAPGTWLWSLGETAEVRGLGVLIGRVGPGRGGRRRPLAAGAFGSDPSASSVSDSSDSDSTTTTGTSSFTSTTIGAACCTAGSGLRNPRSSVVKVASELSVARRTVTSSFRICIETTIPGPDGVSIGCPSFGITAFICLYCSFS